MRPLEGTQTDTAPVRKAKRPDRKRLNSLEDVRRALARTLRMAERVNREPRRWRLPDGTKRVGPSWSVEQQKMELLRCRTLIQGYRALAEMFSGVELERRLKALEEKAQAGAH